MKVMAVLIISFFSELKCSMLMMAPILASLFSVIVRAIVTPCPLLKAQQDTLQDTTLPLPQCPQSSTSFHVSAIMGHEATAVTLLTLLQCQPLGWQISWVTLSLTMVPVIASN